MAVASLCGKIKFLFAFPRGEVGLMYITLEELILLASLIIALLTYVELINKKK